MTSALPGVPKRQGPTFSAVMPRRSLDVSPRWVMQQGHLSLRTMKVGPQRVLQRPLTGLVYLHVRVGSALRLYDNLLNLSATSGLDFCQFQHALSKSAFPMNAIAKARLQMFEIKCIASCSASRKQIVASVAWCLTI